MHSAPVYFHCKWGVQTSLDKTYTGHICVGAVEDQKSKICVCVFVVCCVYTPSRGLREQTQPQPDGKRPAWSVVRGFSPEILLKYVLAHVPNLYHKNTRNGLYKRSILTPMQYVDVLAERTG
jgi:hypothetical protein